MERTKSARRSKNNRAVLAVVKLILSLILTLSLLLYLFLLCASSVQREISSTVITVDRPSEKKTGIPYDFIRALYYVEQGKIDEAEKSFTSLIENKNCPPLLRDYSEDFLSYLDDIYHFRFDDQFQHRHLEEVVTRLFKNAALIAKYLSKYEKGSEFRYASIIPYFCARNFEQHLHYNFRLYELYFRTIIENSDTLSFQDADMLCLYVREFYRTLEGTKDDARTVLLLVDLYRSKYEAKIGENGDYIKQSLYLQAVERWCTKRLNKIGLWALFNSFPDYWF